MPKTIEELRQECATCRMDFAKYFLVPDQKFCTFSCPTGRALHELEPEDPRWKQVDWNSSKYEKFYRD